MSDKNLPKPGDSDYPTDPILIAAIEAERTRQQQSVAKNKNASAAAANLEAFNKARGQQFSDLATYTASHDTGGHGLSGLVASAGRVLSTIDKDSSVHSFYVNADKWQGKTEDAATAYAKNPNAKTLKAYNDAKAEFTRYANQYVKAAKDTRSADEIWGTNSVGSQISTDTKTDSTTKTNTTGTTATDNFTTWGQGTAKGAKTTKLANGLVVTTQTNGVKIYKTKAGSQITVNADGGIEFAVNKAGKPLSEKQVTSIAGMVAAGTTAPPDTNPPAGNPPTGAPPVGAPPAPAPKKKSATELADDYNVQMAVINSDPSLVALFDKAVKTQMPPTAFAAALRNTDFYLKHGANWALAQTKKLGDPGDWKDQTTQASTLIKQTAVDLGMALNPQEVQHLANAALHASGGAAGSISSTWLNTHIATLGTITGKGGTAATTINNLKQFGADYGIEHSDDWYTHAAKSVISKTATQTDFESQITNLAKSKYAPFADQIDKGMTVAQIASPYINSMSNILEVPSASIGLNDHTINKALTSLDGKGQPMAQPLWQFETNLRQDPRWATTKNANDTLSSLSYSILKNFGLMS